jgi:hypothetical protein
MTIFPQPDRGDVAAFVDCMFRYAREDRFINLRAFHDAKKDAPPLFIEPIKVGASDLVDPSAHASMTQRHMLNRMFLPTGLCLCRIKWRSSRKSR